MLVRFPKVRETVRRSKSRRNWLPEFSARRCAPVADHAREDLSGFADTKRSKSTACRRALRRMTTAHQVPQRARRTRAAPRLRQAAASTLFFCEPTSSPCFWQRRKCELNGANSNAPDRRARCAHVLLPCSRWAADCRGSFCGNRGRNSVACRFRFCRCAQCFRFDAAFRFAASEKRATV